MARPYETKCQSGLKHAHKVVNVVSRQVEAKRDQNTEKFGTHNLYIRLK